MKNQIELLREISLSLDVDKYYSISMTKGEVTFQGSFSPETIKNILIAGYTPNGFEENGYAQFQKATELGVFIRIILT